MTVTINRYDPDTEQPVPAIEVTMPTIESLRRAGPSQPPDNPAYVPPFEPIGPGIFKDDLLFDFWRVRIQFRTLVMGGVPAAPNAIEGWIKKSAGVEDPHEQKAMLFKTAIALGIEVEAGWSAEELAVALKDVAGDQHTNCFYHNSRGPFLPDRYFMAMLKENVNILYATERMGPTRKGSRSFFSERCGLLEPQIHFLRDGQIIPKVDGVDLSIAHVMTPKGPMNSLTYVEYMRQPVMEFTLRLKRPSATNKAGDKHDGIPDEWWPSIWVMAGANGIGARRSQQFGQFVVQQFERI